MSKDKTNLNTTKEQERAELHRAIWQIATDLRGSVDGWDFKQYVLGILFYRFISENLTNYINADERRAGKKDFDYANLSDKEAEFGRADTVKEKGFYILPSALFVNVRKNLIRNYLGFFSCAFVSSIESLEYGVDNLFNIKRNDLSVSLGNRWNGRRFCRCRGGFLFLWHIFCISQAAANRALNFYKDFLLLTHCTTYCNISV
jgi:type I restriction-modification system DNA methylase subunit